MTKQEYELEKREQYIADSRHEELMRSDYDYFIEYSSSYIKEYQDAYEALTNHLFHYGWDYSGYEIEQLRRNT
jgi:hypothetical protein